MPEIRDSQVRLIAYEGEFQLLKAQVLDVVAPPVAPGTPSIDQLLDLLAALRDKTERDNIFEVRVPLGEFLSLVRTGKVTTQFAQLKTQFAAAAAKASALNLAKKIAKEGAANLSVPGFNKGLGELFDALDLFKRGLDLLSDIGVKGVEFDKARTTLGDALDVVKEKKGSGG
jgi:hypothetical protein